MEELQIEMDKLVLVNVAPNFDQLRKALEYLMAAQKANSAKFAALDEYAPPRSNLPAAKQKKTDYSR